MVIPSKSKKISSTHLLFVLFIVDNSNEFYYTNNNNNLVLIVNIEIIEEEEECETYLSHIHTLKHIHLGEHYLCSMCVSVCVCVFRVCHFNCLYTLDCPSWSCLVSCSSLIKKTKKCSFSLVCDHIILILLMLSLCGLPLDYFFWTLQVLKVTTITVSLRLRVISLFLILYANQIRSV